MDNPGPACCTILHEDGEIVAVNKAAGIAVIPARGEDSAFSLKEQLEQQLRENLFVIHRIDRLTSGIVLFARNAKTHADLCGQFERREVRKEYHAAVDGVLTDGIICNEPIKEFGSGRMGVHAGGKSSLTEIDVVQSATDVSLIKVFPKTGRRHQIRVHLYHTGHPILGDPLYGKARPVRNAARLMLHAYEISFNHPEHGMMTLTAEVDALWKSELARFGLG